jgi:hypothetical protein
MKIWTDVYYTALVLCGTRGVILWALELKSSAFWNMLTDLAHRLNNKVTEQAKASSNI